MQIHKSVLLDETIEFLALKEAGVYIDATLGGGGHARAILESNKNCKLISIDWDLTVIETVGVALSEEFKPRFVAIWGNFSKIDFLIKERGFDKVDGILADFGTSQIQIKNKPGFSIFQPTQFLDMRFSKSHYKITAADILNNASEKELAYIFYTYGEEKNSHKIAKAIVEARKIKEFKIVEQLVNLVEALVDKKNKTKNSNKKRKIHPATKVFQALRIVVNNELENIKTLLKNGLSLLKPGGRFVCISFHSLEDRIIKTFFKEQARLGLVKILTKKVCKPSDLEVYKNNSSRSAKCRAFEVL